MESLTLIVNGCLKRDHTYQKLLYERYYGFALKTVFRYIYWYDKAVDATNDGFIKFFNKIEQFNMSSETDLEKMLMGYLKRIMINTAIDELRRCKMTPEIGGIPEYVWETAEDKAETPDQKILYKELIVLIKELPPQYRSVFNLYVIDGFNHLEIADILKIPVGTSKSNLSRARQLLQNTIKKSEEAALCRI